MTSPQCPDVQAALLSGVATQEQRDHVSGCAECRGRLGQVDAMTETLADGALWIEPAPDLRERIVGAVTAQPAVEGQRPPSHLWRAVVATAAVAIIFVAAGVLSRSPSPDWSVTLPGVGEEAGASGVIQGWNEPQGTRVLLEVAGLPEAPPGSVYELWFSEGPLHVSSGTFTAADRVELWVGVARKDFPRIWVTLEPVDEDESPSGRTVLDTGAASALSRGKRSV